MIVSPVPGRAPLSATVRAKSPAPLPSTAAFECDRHVGPSPWLVHEGEDVAIREGLPFELGQPLIGPPAVVRHRRAGQASQVLDPTAALRVLQDPRMMLGEESLWIQDADVWRPSEPSLRATLVARLVLPADLHLLFHLALLSEHHEVGKAEGLRGTASDRLGHVLGGRKPLLRIERHRSRHYVGKRPRDARHEIAGGSVQLRPPLRELLHGTLTVLRCPESV